MIIYSITYAIEASLEQEWELYMKDSFIPSLMNCGYFKSYQHTKILPEEGEDLAFNLQLSCSDLKVLNNYLEKEKPLHDMVLNSKYGGKFACFQTKLKKLNP